MGNKFSNFNLDKILIEKLDLRKIDTPTDIQKDVIPKILEGKYVIGQSKTGTGKTLSYLLPSITLLINKKNRSLIIAPTKELATQIYNEAVFYMNGTGFKPVLLLAGENIEKNNDDVKNNPDFIIGVPGRIIKLIENGNLKISQVDTLVLDEVDFLVDLGFKKDLELILDKAKSIKQLLVFSATLSPTTKKVLDLASNQKIASRIDAVNTLPADIENFFVHIGNNDVRDETVIKIINVINPYLCIIFTRTKKESEHLYKTLKDLKLSVDMLNGDMQSGQRKKVTDSFKKAKFQYLVSTDLASRGLDVEGITHIINYTMPYNELDYIHRAGRTGRMGQSGTVISICNELDEGYLRKYLQNINIKIEAVKIDTGSIVVDKSYKGVRARYNIEELKKIDKIADIDKKKEQRNKVYKNKYRLNKGKHDK